ncbi:MAG: LysR family transcriptional regulator [Bacteroidales bacterium]|nr:LysR family transcriptional regulator [Bacteroidales bacterium]
MELRQLRYFVTVARTLNFSEASRRLFITQGTLSQQIRQLEDEAGSRLFERTSHSVALTEAGEELLPLAIATLEASDACLERMKELRGSLTGTLNIGTTQSFITVVGEAVKSFMKEHRDVKLNVSVDTAADLLEKLRDREIDMALAFRSIEKFEDIESEVLFKTSLCVVVRGDHPLAAHDSLRLSDLAGHGLILPGKGLQSRRAVDRFVGIDTSALDVRAEFNDPEAIMDMVQSTGLATIVSPIAACYRPKLRTIPLEGGKFVMTGCVHRLKEGYRKHSSEVFLSALRDAASLERISGGLTM